jgi:hypothetical protein
MSNTNDGVAKLSLRNIFDTSKADRQHMVDRVLEEIAEGNLDPLEIALQVKIMSDVLERFNDPKKSDKAELFKRAVLDAASKYGKKFEYKNAECRIGEAGTVYDFSKCGDPAWDEANFRFLAAKEDMKKREEFLKTVPPEGMAFVDQQSGEVVTVYPPTKRSTTTLFISVK